MSAATYQTDKYLDKVARFTLGVIATLTIGTFFLDLSLPLGMPDWVIYFLPLFLTFWLKGKRVSLIVAGLCTVLVYMNLLFSHVGEPVPTAFVDRSWGVLVLWVMAVLLTERKREEEERERLILQLQDALAKIKTLSGLLPICFHCKKIRDDKGYWNQVEAYISTHSEATFTHGLCPVCFKRHYPEAYQQTMGEESKNEQ